jgi:hypothetical protein
MISFPGWQTKVLSQQPAHKGVQLTCWPQLLVTKPHLPAQVAASLAQPQPPGVPLPPQACPWALQF